MMHLRKRRVPDDPGNSGSLNDLSFLLIIFFLVIAGFNINKGFLMNLPDRDRPRVVQTEELLRCSLGPDGSLSLGGKAVTEEELRGEIKAMREKFPNMTFLLEIDPETPYHRVVYVIHEIRVLKVENFSFRMSGGEA